MEVYIQYVQFQKLNKLSWTRSSSRAPAPGLLLQSSCSRAPAPGLLLQSSCSRSPAPELPLQHPASSTQAAGPGSLPPAPLLWSSEKRELILPFTLLFPLVFFPRSMDHLGSQASKSIPVFFLVLKKIFWMLSQSLFTIYIIFSSVKIDRIYRRLMVEHIVISTVLSFVFPFTGINIIANYRILLIDKWLSNSSLPLLTVSTLVFGYLAVALLFMYSFFINFLASTNFSVFISSFREKNLYLVLTQRLHIFCSLRLATKNSEGNKL
ncbi:Protein CBG06715 [Caenorhabditis briggsae]|uniref:Protein CBG06715 n=1 Tax=Caenorhabditis briggsae TaxID=6238 RepID=A8X2X7_CAEBR|nr:Protein CBG06715 [Caenorhabditis briggsae]CAP26987.1 Protein CBG06715 [Caenorhabditis briggsae]